MGRWAGAGGNQRKRERGRTRERGRREDPRAGRREDPWAADQGGGRTEKAARGTEAGPAGRWTEGQRREQETENEGQGAEANGGREAGRLAKAGKRQERHC